jgi:predicted ABC-type ATPase
METRPSVVVLGGPNGSGKSTAAVRFLHDTLSIMEFVNADEIARGLSPFNPSGVAVQAGRIMLERMDELAHRGESFAFETTLASRSFAPWLKSLQSKGYRFRLFFVWLRTPELNVIRVAQRVALGGHNIPEETIRRRYSRSITNLFDLYLPIADSWEIVDNSGSVECRLVASREPGCEPIIVNPDAWTALRARYDATRSQPED